jgi:hypothetical protein
MLAAAKNAAKSLESQPVIENPCLHDSSTARASHSMP